MQSPSVYVHGGFGPRLGEIATATSIDRSWAVGSPGRGRVICAADEPQRALLDPSDGHAIVIDSPHYPYAWVGMLERTERNPASGELDLYLVAAERVLSERYVTSTEYAAQAAGMVIHEMFADTDAANGVGFGLRHADSHPSGPPIEAQTFPDATLWSAMNHVARQSGFEWWVEWDASRRGIVGSVEFGPRRGSYQPVTLIDGGNCEIIREAIDGRQTYAIRMTAGQSSVTQAYTARTRVTQNVAELPPSTVHGFEVERSELGSSPLSRREVLMVAENLKSTGGVRQAAELLAGRPQRPNRLIEARVTVEDDALWAALGPGNVVRFQSASAFLGRGFSGPVRVLSVEPKEEMGDLMLSLQVLRG